MEYEINAVDKPYHSLGHDAITAIGNLDEGWSISAKSAMVRLEMNRDKFFVRDATSGERIYLAVEHGRTGRKWLRTYQDGRATNHMMALRSTRDCQLID